MYRCPCKCTDVGTMLLPFSIPVGLEWPDILQLWSNDSSLFRGNALRTFQAYRLWYFAIWYRERKIRVHHVVNFQMGLPLMGPRLYRDSILYLQQLSILVFVIVLPGYLNEHSADLEVFSVLIFPHRTGRRHVDEICKSHPLTWNCNLLPILPVQFPGKICIISATCECNLRVWS